MAFHPDRFGARSAFARDVSTLASSLSVEQLKATDPREAAALVATLVQVLHPGSAAESTTARCLEVLSTIVAAGEPLAVLVTAALEEPHYDYMLSIHPHTPACLQLLEALGEGAASISPAMLSLVPKIMDSIVQEVDGSESGLGVLATILVNSGEARAIVKAHPTVRGFYRILIHLLCDQKVDIIVDSLCILSAMAHHDPDISQKLFSHNNLHQTFQLIVNLVANCAKPRSQSGLISIVEFLLSDATMAALLEEYDALEQSLSRLLPLLTTPATQHTMGAVKLLASIANHSAHFQTRIAALVTSYGHSIDQIVEALLQMILSTSASAGSVAIAQLLSVLCPADKVAKAIVDAGKSLEMVLAAALEHGSISSKLVSSYGAAAIEASGVFLQGIWSYGSATLRAAICSALVSIPQAPEQIGLLLARAQEPTVAATVEITALDVALLLCAADEHTNSAASAEQLAKLAAVSIMRASSAASVQKALLIATNLDTSITANAITESRGLVALKPRSPTAATRGVAAVPPMVHDAPADKLAGSTGVVQDSSTLPVELALAEQSLAREHELESRILELQREAIRLQARLDRVPETHTPRKGPEIDVTIDTSPLEAQVTSLKEQLTQREVELDDTYRKLIAVCKAYNTSGVTIEQSTRQITQLKQAVTTLETALENATADLKSALEAAKDENFELRQAITESSSALEIAHKGRDTAEDAKRQLHVSLRHQVDLNRSLQKQLEDEQKKFEEITSQLQACQHSLLMCQQELEHTRRECSDMFGRAQHFEAEYENQRNVMQKTSEFTALIHSLSGNALVPPNDSKGLQAMRRVDYAGTQGGPLHGSYFAPR